MFCVVDITDGDITREEMVYRKRKRILFKSLSRMMKYFGMEVNTYHCCDPDHHNGSYPERFVFDHDRRRYRICKKCSNVCTGRCSEVAGLTPKGSYRFHTCPKSH